MVYWVPGDAGDCAGVSREDGYGGLPPDVVDVNLVVLTPRGHEVLVDAAETAVDGVVALLDPDELPDQALLLNVPQVDALLSHIHQGISVRQTSEAIMIEGIELILVTCPRSHCVVTGSSD